MPLEESIQFLQKITTVAPVRGTDFMEITVKHESREQATLIANNIAQTSVEHAQQISRSRAQRALKALDDEIAAQEELIESNRKEIAVFVQENGIPEEPSKNISLNRQIELSLIQSQYNQAKEAYDQSRLMLREMIIKQKEARLHLLTPHSPITIHEYAQ